MGADAEEEEEDQHQQHELLLLQLLLRLTLCLLLLVQLLVWFQLLMPTSGGTVQRKVPVHRELPVFRPLQGKTLGLRTASNSASFPNSLFLVGLPRWCSMKCMPCWLNKNSGPERKTFWLQSLECPCQKQTHCTRVSQSLFVRNKAVAHIPP